ncbi:Cytosolic Fe-S cluster assembly factor nar1 [Cyphellophora attinorum]|uniref:Cytosolic Fe-S cluster assembly factor NAR1 n=1 Tax=Cyphellophora attinorum TaxID=1664694 RepID=A0A0N1P3A3_9EURO|nr:Cytosolic Fe-S cluster assembly factor nar1 [Phialophora attinorum]KPI43702.1 Cytosolic Fe-S cluster assembly factor nar1 [Phialophora attinorum]
MSAILSSDDLNDFISPGVACIKPVETLPKQEDYNPYEVTTEDKVQAQNPAPASISLTDCLACSGCVTSAEAVLVSLQSHTEVLNTLDTHPALKLDALSPSINGHTTADNAPGPQAKLFVASVSPQVRASIAATYGISEKRAGYMIEQFLSGSQGLRIGGQHNSGFQYVIDTNRMREACLILGAEEVDQAMVDDDKKKPLLTSACPGWICYAEKTHPHVLPHLSGLKSPQALSGVLLKSVLSKDFGIQPSQIWHLAIMPCFDKKLEASREELTNKWWDGSTPGDAIRDVDCVITSRELLSLANARGIVLSQLPLRPVPAAHRPIFPDARLSRFLFSPPSRRTTMQSNPEAGTSGGYLHHVLLTHQTRHPGSRIQTQRGRNADVIEYQLLDASDQIILKCARYYGFRNIQNLVRKLKPARQSKLPGAAVRRAAPKDTGNDLAYIKIDDVKDILPETRAEELVTPASNPGAQKEWQKRVDEAYFSMSDDSGDEEDCDLLADGDDDVQMSNGDHATGKPDEEVVNGVNVTQVKDMLRHWSTLVGVPLQTLAYTTYRKVESDVGKKKAKTMGDTERIAAIAGLSGGGW